MIKKLFYLILLLAGLRTSAQNLPIGAPSGSVTVQGKLIVDSIFFLPQRTDTMFNPGRPGAMVFAYGQAWLYLGSFWSQLTGIAWGRIPGSITAQHDLDSALNTKQTLITNGYGWKLVGNAGTFDSANVRKVDTVGRLNDSTLFFAINGHIYNVLLRGTAAGASVLSITLNTPLGLFVSNVSYTSDGAGHWSGTLALGPQSANSFLSGPASGSPGTPGFRVLGVPDLPTNIPNANLLNSTLGLSLGASGSSPGFSATTVALGNTIILNLPTASATITGILSAADWIRFNTATSTIVTAVNGQIGAVITLNADSLGAYPIDFTNFHNGWVLSVDTIHSKLVFSAPGSGSGITQLNGLNPTTQFFAMSTGGVPSAGGATSPSITSATATHTFAFPIVNGADTGLVTPAQKATWDGKQAAITGNGFPYFTGSSITFYNGGASTLYGVGSGGGTGVIALGPGLSIVGSTLNVASGDSGLHAFVQPLPVGTSITVGTSAAKRFVLYDTSAGNTASVVMRARQQQITDSTFNVLNPQLALKAPLASPALTGNPTAPTQSPGDNTTKIATDAFVTAAISSSGADSGFALLYGTLSTGPIAKVIAAGKRYIIVDTNRLGGNPFAMVTQSGLQKVVDSIYGTLVNTWYNDRTDGASDSTGYPDGSGNLALRGIQDTSTDGTVTITKTLSTAHTVVYNFHASAATGAPFPDNAALAKNTADITKLAVLDVSQVPTGTTVRDSVPSVSTGIAGTNVGNIFQVAQQLNFGGNFGGNWVPLVANTSNLGSLSLYLANVYTANWIAPNTANITSTGSNGINLKINGVQKMSILSTGQQMDSAYIGNVFAGTVTGGNPDSVLTTNNGFVRKVPAAAIGGGGSQTLPQVLNTGRTFSHNDSILLADDSLFIRNGVELPDSVNSLREFVGGTPAAVATLWSDNFLSRTSFGTNYTTAAASATYAFQGDTVVNLSGGNGGFGNSITRNTYTVSETMTEQVRGKVVSIPGTTAGIAFGITGSNFSFYAFFDMSSSSGNLGKILFQTALGTTFLTSSAITPVAGDSLLLTLQERHDSMIANYQDLTQATSVSMIYKLSDWGAGGSNYKSNTGLPQLYTLGGSFNWNGWTFTNDATKGIPVLCVSHSVGHGFGVTGIANRYMNVLFGSNYSYFAVEAGSSDLLIDKINELPEILSYGAGKVIVDIGSNDANAGLALTTFRARYNLFITSLLQSGSKVLIMNIIPRNGVNVLPYNQIILNIANKYGLKYVDNYTSLQGTAGNLNATYDFGDHVHINAAGHLVVVANIEAADPAILNEASNYSMKVGTKRMAINAPLQTNDTAAFNNVVYMGIAPLSGDSSTQAPNTQWVKREIASNNAGGGFVINGTSLQTAANFNISGGGTAGQLNTNGTFVGTGSTNSPNIFSPTMVANTNSDVMVGFELAPHFTDLTFTGNGHIGLRLDSGFLNVPNTNTVLGSTGDPGTGRLLVTGGGEDGIIVSGGTGVGQSIQGTINSVSTAVSGLSMSPTLSAQANGVTSALITMTPTFTDNSHTGVNHYYINQPYNTTGANLWNNGLQYDILVSGITYSRITNAQGNANLYQNGNTTIEHRFESFAASAEVVQIDGSTAPGGNTLNVMNSGSTDTLLNVKGAMNVVGVGHVTPDLSALLNVGSTTKGSAPFPRMTTTQMNSISSPLTGLGVWNTDSSYIMVYTGAAWHGLQLTNTVPGNPSSGTYTPTITTVTNCSSPSSGLGHWIRIGNQVTVDVPVTVIVTTGGSATEFYVSLPVSSAISSGTDVTGQGQLQGAYTIGPGITGNTTNHVADVTYTQTASSSGPNMFLHFTYTVD